MTVARLWRHCALDPSQTQGRCIFCALTRVHLVPQSLPRHSSVTTRRFLRFWRLDVQILRLWLPVFSLICSLLALSLALVRPFLLWAESLYILWVSLRLIYSDQCLDYRTTYSDTPLPFPQRTLTPQVSILWCLSSCGGIFVVEPDHITYSSIVLFSFFPIYLMFR